GGGAPDAAGRLREGLLPGRADQPRYLGGCRAGRWPGRGAARAATESRCRMTHTVLALAGEMTTGEKVTFWILAPFALLGAIGMVWARNAVHSALWLVRSLLTLGACSVPP